LTERLHEPAIESIAAALKSLRTRAGLTVDRLKATGLTVEPLAGLRVVRQVELAQRLPREQAIVAAVRGVAARLDTATRLIVDAALALRLLSPDAVEAAEASGIYGPDLAGRRHALAEAWGRLHAALGEPVAPPAPSERTLRGDVEVLAFSRLAERLLTASSLDASREAGPATGPAPAEPVGDRPGGTARVLVVGSAVIDHVIAVSELPRVGLPSQSHAYQRFVGGKGLNQAVAAARLGMSVHLLSTVGDDASATEILDALARENVGVDLLITVPDSRTPVAFVVVTDDGTSLEVGWKNEPRLSLRRRDAVSGALRARLDAVDTVLLTLEPPIETVDAFLATMAGMKAPPRTILTASPPPAGPTLAPDRLRNVDYLVGTRSELHSLVPGAAQDSSPDELATQLRLLGVGAVCIAEEFSSVIRTSDLSVDIPHFPTVQREAPGARDAFAAALALRLHETGGELTADDAFWATAAMAASQTVRGVADAMPTPKEVNRVLSVASPT
jgi:ribokinase